MGNQSRVKSLPFLNSFFSGGADFGFRSDAEDVWTGMSWEKANHGTNGREIEWGTGV